MLDPSATPQSRSLTRTACGTTIALFLTMHPQLNSEDNMVLVMGAGQASVLVVTRSASTGQQLTTVPVGVISRAVVIMPDGAIMSTTGNTGGITVTCPAPCRPSCQRLRRTVR